jgi:hypothetical protein
MAKLFIGIALVVMLATAALSFLAHGNIDKLQTELRDTKGRIAIAEAAAKAAKSEVDKAQKDAKEAQDKASDATGQLAAATAKAETAQKAADEAKLIIEEKDKEIAAAKANNTPAPVVAQTGPTQDQLDAANAKAAAAEKERDEAKAVVESQQSHVKDMEAKLAAAETKERKRAQKFGAAGIQGRILAVNSGWNFVVLSVGDKQGVAVNSPLIVVRGSEPVARLRVTSVEPSTSIADVLPGSVRRGVTVQPGDTVIFEGGRDSSSDQAPTKPSADAAGGTAAVQPLQ